MTKKKILAGVLSAAMVLSVSTTAFAAPEAPDNNKAVTKPGETEYEAGVGMMGAELDVELPGSMKAFLNPYSAEVAVEAGTTPTKSKEGIVSWAYEVVNNTADFGIMVDVKDGKVTPAATVAIDAPGAAEAATAKTAALVLQAGATAADATKYDKTKTATAQATDTDQGIFVFSTTGASKSKIAYAPAKTTAAGKVYLGLTGAISKVDAAGEDLEWTEDDTITATFTLKINPSAKTQADAFNGGTTTTGAAKLEADAVTLTGLAGVTWAAGTASYTSTAAYGGTYAIQIDPAKLTATQTVTLSATTDDTGSFPAAKTITSSSTAGNQCKLQMDIAGNGNGDGNYCEYTIKIDDTSDNSSTTYTVLVGTKP